MAFVLSGHLLSLLHFLLNVFVGCSSVNLLRHNEERITDSIERFTSQSAKSQIMNTKSGIKGNRVADYFLVKTCF